MLLPHIENFFLKKKRSGTSLSVSFFCVILKKNVCFIVWLPLILEIFDNMYIAIVH